VLKFFDWLTARLATFNIIDSPSQQQFLINQKVLTKERSIVFGMGSVSGVDLKRFKPSKKVLTEVRHELGIPEDAFVFIYLGRLNKDKGILDLALAFSSLENKNTYLLVVGPDEGDFVEEMKRLCGDNIDQLRFVVYTTTPERFLAASNALCLPSYREGFGSVVIEAAAVGIPAVGSRIYGLMDAIAENKSGLLFEAKDVSALSDCLMQLVDNKQLRLRLGQNAKQRAESYFSSKMLVKAWLDYYTMKL
jgi:glycosyltransferase involved in cell wall biosynthesis